MEKKPINKRKKDDKIKTKTKSKKEIKNEKNKPKKKKKIIDKILIILFLILIILIGGIVYKSKRNGGGMQGLLSTLAGHDEETLKDLKPIRVLLMGVSTDNGGKLTDTIMVGSYDPKNQKAAILSIPRDTFVGKNLQKGTGSDKINSLYQRSPEITKSKVEELTGLEIPYYMVIENQALIKLVDVIGGVEFDVPIDMKYDDTSQDLHINLKKGYQKLNGDQAEQLLRFRHGNRGETYPAEYGDNDMGRMKTQRRFITETAKQTLKAKNILRIKDIIDIVYEYVETNLSISTIKDYVPYAVNFDPTSIRSEVLPGVSVGPSTKPSAPYWFFLADKKETKLLVDELFAIDEIVPKDIKSEENIDSKDNGKDEENQNLKISQNETSKIKIELINATGSSSAMQEVKKKLVNKGYKVVISNGNRNKVSKTIINVEPKLKEKFGENIQKILGVGNILVGEAVGPNDANITIIIGKDYLK